MIALYHVSDVIDFFRNGFLKRYMLKHGRHADSFSGCTHKSFYQHGKQKGSLSLQG